MADQLRFHPKVVSDIRGIIDWYDGVDVRITNRFRTAIDQRFEEIGENPERFSMTFAGMRYARIERLPYLILFESLVDRVHVLGVFHVSSDPQKWLRRHASEI